MLQLRLVNVNNFGVSLFVHHHNLRHSHWRRDTTAAAVNKGAFSHARVRVRRLTQSIGEEGTMLPLHYSGADYDA